MKTTRKMCTTKKPCELAKHELFCRAIFRPYRNEQKRDTSVSEWTDLRIWYVGLRKLRSSEAIRWRFHMMWRSSATWLFFMKHQRSNPFVVSKSESKHRQRLQIYLQGFGGNGRLSVIPAIRFSHKMILNRSYMVCFTVPLLDS